MIVSTVIFIDPMFRMINEMLGSYFLNIDCHVYPFYNFLIGVLKLNKLAFFLNQFNGIHLLILLFTNFSSTRNRH